MSNTIRAALDAAEQHATAEVWAGHPLAIILEALIKQARAALNAEPAGEGPSERIVSIAKVVQECAFAHKSDARLIGNVCAEDVADLCDAVIDRWARPDTLAAPEVGEGRWSEGICGNGAAILFDAVMVLIEEVVRALNRTPTAPAGFVPSQAYPGAPAWIRPAAPPAPEVVSRSYKLPEPGEAGKLAAELRHFVAEYKKMRGLDPEGIYSIQEGVEGREAHLRVSQLTRIATLLEQLSAPAPVVGDQERLRIMVAGICYGYKAGHDDTVEGRYGDPDEVAADCAPEILGEQSATFESMLEQQAQPAPAAPEAAGFVPSQAYPGAPAWIRPAAPASPEVGEVGELIIEELEP